MSRDARKKEKHRLKRKEKQQRLRKLNARTALQRIAAEGGQLECWITPEDWKEQGIIRRPSKSPAPFPSASASAETIWTACEQPGHFSRFPTEDSETRRGAAHPHANSIMEIPRI